MRIIGLRREDGAPVTEFELVHGHDPRADLLRRGFVLTEPESASRIDGELVLRLRVARNPAADMEPAEPAEPTNPSEPPRDPGVPDDAVPLVRQRVGCYALIESERGLLATEFSSLTRSVDQWGLPGGGIEDDEQPVDAVIREVWEETAQRVEIEEFIDVASGHWIGPNPSGVIEDYHAIRLLYRGRCLQPTEPQVLDVGGTTSAARWIPLTDWEKLNWTDGWRTALATFSSR